MLPRLLVVFMRLLCIDASRELFVCAFLYEPSGLTLLINKLCLLKEIRYSVCVRVCVCVRARVIIQCIDHLFVRINAALTEAITQIKRKLHNKTQLPLVDSQ